MANLLERGLSFGEWSTSFRSLWRSDKRLPWLNFSQVVFLGQASGPRQIEN
jgi:hypothetical protein